MNAFELIKKEFDNADINFEVPAVLKPCAVSINKTAVNKALKKFVKGTVYGIAAIIYAAEILCLVVLDLFILLGLVVKAGIELKETVKDVLVNIIVKAIEFYQALKEEAKVKYPIIKEKVKKTYLNVSLKTIELIVLTNLSCKLAISKAKAAITKAANTAWNFRKEILLENNEE